MAAYCKAFHHALMIYLRPDGVFAKPCCQIKVDEHVKLDDYNTSPYIKDLQQKNINGIWFKGCDSCKHVEDNKDYSYRQSMNEKFTSAYDNQNIALLDLFYDNSCNLGCRTCGPGLSSFWANELKINKDLISYNSKQSSQIIEEINKLNLTSIEQIKLVGGEPFLSNDYWRMLDSIAQKKPDIFHNCELLIQTNGTLPLRDIHLELIKKFKLVKISFSIDAIGSKFEYIRYPADWNKTLDNLLWYRANSPSNVMFTFEETISLFNLYYKGEVESWVNQNFSSNSSGDPVHYNYHLAGGYSDILNTLTTEYASAVNYAYVGREFKENPSKIKHALGVISDRDQFRNQSFAKTFPELAKFYKRYL